MLAFLLASILPVDPWDLVRVEDPDHPAAQATSAYGAVLFEPPEPGTRWRWESVPETDAIPHESYEVVQATHADLWHRDGARGQGVKVAIFDSGWFEGLGNPRLVGDYQTHDCWVHASCEVPIEPWRPRFAAEEGSHGWACAEVVRAVAPDADLHLVRVNSFTQFEAAADWAIRAGVDVISMSMSFYNDSFYDGSGPFAAVIARLEAHDILLVTSAGNDARAHWSGRWLDGDGDGRMDLDGDNGLDVWLGAGPRTIFLNWDRHGRCGDTDLDLYVYDAAGNIVGRSLDRQSEDADRCQPVERARAYAATTGWYRLEVVAHRGDLTHLDVALHGRAGVTFAPTQAPWGAVVDPAAHPLALAVGAVHVADYIRGDIEPFSSWGPTHAGVPKPEIAGPDGLTTAATGPGNFFGTSASTPAVAGLIAVILSDDPSLTPRRASQRLIGWALDQGTGPFAQPDPRWGAGKARLPPRELQPLPCGQRPLIMPLLFLPVWAMRRRRRRQALPERSAGC